MLHIHFRGNMDFWDPMLLLGLSEKHWVIVFDPAGVGRSSGTVPSNYQGWADNLIAFVDALSYTKIDLLGFSMGGSVAQMVALTRPELVRKMVLCGTGPSQPAGLIPGIIWPREMAPQQPIARFAAAQTKEEMEAAIAFAFFPDSERGRKDARHYLQRIHDARDEAEEPGIIKLTDAETTEKQKQPTADWNRHNSHNSFDRLHELQCKVLILNGNEDKVIPTSRSWELMRLIPNAQLTVYPQSGHGFLWQYPEKVAHDINDFLDNHRTDFLDDEFSDISD